MPRELTISPKTERERIIGQLRPLVYQALVFSFGQHREMLLKIIYQILPQRKIQLIRESSEIDIYRPGGVLICGSKKNLSEETTRMRVEIILSALEGDIEQLFGVIPNMHEVITLELSCKFRNAAMVSFYKTEYRQKKETQFC